MQTIIVSIAVCCLILIVPLFPQIFGHGLGGETLPPVTVGNRNATIFLGIIPEVFDPDSEEQSIKVRFFDADTNALIEHVTYLIELKKDDKRIFRYMFHDEFGDLFLKIKPTDSEDITIHGKQEPLLGGWMKKDDFTPVTLEGPIFTSGGLYNFNIEILTLDSDDKILDERITYNGAISVAENTLHEITGKDGNQYQMTTISYYDTINDFQFSPENSLLGFSMPFDWSEENINQVFILHQELQIPKNFPDLLATKYDATVNGVSLLEEAIVIDDYSRDSRTVHLILRSDELLELREDAIKNASDRIDFTFKPSETRVPSLTSVSKNVVYDVTLSWNPATIQSDENTRFYFDIKQRFVPSKEVTPAKFDLVFLQNEKEIFRQMVDAQMNAEPKSNFIDHTFLPSQEGSVKIFVENINDEFMATSEFVVVVEEKQQLGQFPMRLSSMIQNESGEKLEGNYNVDLTWFSNPINIDEESEFIITIYDKNTERPVPQSEYDFVLLQNNEELYRTTGFASVGGSFENFVFTKENLGEVTLRIENIDQSSEFAEISIVVTPEFPMGSLIILAVIFPLVIILFRLKNNFAPNLKI